MRLARCTGAVVLGVLLGIGLSPTSGRAECIPSPHSDDSDVPCGIVLVGTSNSVPDPRGEFLVIVRDLAQNPVEGCEVSIDFQQCFDVQVSLDQPWPGLSVECVSGAPSYAIVRGITDTQGTVVFRIVGGARNTGQGSPAAGFKCARVFVNGVELTIPVGGLNVAAYDQNSSGGVNPADVALMLSDAFSPGLEGRSDFNCSNTINPVDVSMMLQASLQGGSQQSASDYCW
jgi:hypothetical protein